MNDKLIRRLPTKAPFLGLELALLLSGCASAAVGAPEPASVSDSVLVGTAPEGGAVEGAAAPDFVGAAHDGNNVTLSSLRGRTVILWFYSRDETPMAIREAIDFRDAWAGLAQQGIAVVGVSTDGIDAHKEFAARLGLPFPLVSDPHANVARAYGVPAPYGVNDRRTFVIGPDGTVERIYRTVDVENHVAEVVAHLG